jgi:hypothetical protein
LIAAAARTIAKLRMHPPPARTLSAHHSARMSAAHDLFGKPETTPDQVGGRLFRIMTYKRRMIFSENRRPLFRITRETATPS